MAGDTPKHYVGGPVGREMTDDEAYQFGLMLFDAINAERTSKDQPDEQEQPPAES